MLNLKPCPFCGGTKAANIQLGRDLEKSWLFCRKCGSRGPENQDDSSGTNLNEVVATWNTREGKAQ